MITPNHCAVYTFAVEHCNRLGWKEKFSFPSQMTMEAVGIKAWRTYIKVFSDLVEWGFFVLHQKATNQYSANVIAIAKNAKAHAKALDEAMQNHSQKHRQKQSEYNKTNIQTHKNTNSQEYSAENPQPQKFSIPTVQEIKEYCTERKNEIDAQRFFDYYESVGWSIGKSKMKNWKAAVHTWERNNKSEPPKKQERVDANGNRRYRWKVDGVIREGDGMARSSSKATCGLRGYTYEEID